MKPWCNWDLTCFRVVDVVENSIPSFWSNRSKFQLPLHSSAYSFICTLMSNDALLIRKLIPWINKHWVSRIPVRTHEYYSWPPLGSDQHCAKLGYLSDSTSSGTVCFSRPVEKACRPPERKRSLGETLFFMCPITVPCPVSQIFFRKNLKIGGKYYPGRYIF